MADVTMNLGERPPIANPEVLAAPEAKERFERADLEKDAADKSDRLGRETNDLLDLFAEVELPDGPKQEIGAIDQQARELNQQAQQEIRSVLEPTAAADLFSEKEEAGQETLKPFEAGSEAIGARVLETIRSEKAKAEAAGDTTKLEWLEQWEQSEKTNGRIEIELSFGDIGQERQISGQSNLNRVDQFKVGAETAAYKPISGENPDIALSYGLEEQSMHKNEWLNYQISRVLGLDVVPPTVLRDAYAGEGSVQKWEAIDGDSGDWMKADSPQAKRDMEAIAALHYATKQADGHKHNTLLNREGRVKSFDNGLSFTPLTEEDHLRTLMENGKSKADAYKMLAKLRDAGLVAPFKSRAYEMVSPSPGQTRKLSGELQYKLDTFLNSNELQDEVQKQFQTVFEGDYGNRQFIDFLQRVIELDEHGFTAYMFPS